MPYIYSLSYHTYQTGAPSMRALFMDFPNDPNVSDLGDEYMFGPAFLVAPVTDQGMTSRKVYLPAGAEWFNYWTNEKFKGGQTITVDAPIDKLPLFVRAGSIVPMGAPIDSTSEVQKIAKVRVYPGADAEFTLFDDDGNTYAYEKGGGKVTQLRWSESAGKLDGADAGLVEVIGR
jgi:alpha-glucosidase (family GH31 glycosyl hydrolase)